MGDLVVTSLLVVDDIVYTTPGVWPRSIFQLIDDHVDGCYVCTGEATYKEQLVWVKGDPIIRFTPSGLEVA